MCPLNYNRNRKKHKHLTYQERLMIERWINKDNKSNTENGVKASTTHNIYGVYDMSGGAWENVMDNFNYEVGSSGFDTGEILLISSKHLKQYYTSPEDLHDGYGVNYDLTFYGDSVYEVSASAYRHSPVNSIGGTSNSWYLIDLIFLGYPHTLGLHVVVTGLIVRLLEYLVFTDLLVMLTGLIPSVQFSARFNYILLK
ncbi:MAG TPA: hypothetical protein GX713_04865 [Mollicutes bacterium]|nr:hypothetical protein [Mollicutes bacterium]